MHPSFRDLLAKTIFQIITMIGDPIGYRIADNNAVHWQRIVINERRDLDSGNGIPYLYMDTGIRKSKENLHKS